MKKLATLLLAGAVVVLYSCGPSAKEKEAKRIADSTRVADSIAKVQMEQKRIADSIAKVQEEKRKMDSIAHEDSVKKHLIKPPKKAVEKKAKKAEKKVKK
jgi:hypothetical protein